MNTGFSLYWKVIEIYRNDKMVAKGVQFEDGKCVIRWDGEHSSIVIWNSFEDLQKVSGHPGTKIIINNILTPPKKCTCGALSY